MKILKLEAENFKRLKAVSITPKGDIVEISGKNGQGKSSVLDAIWVALGGLEAVPAVPVRAGASEATVRLDLGTYVVTRKFKVKEGGEQTSLLVIETPDGVKAKGPQTLLNELMGRFTMDPLAFSRMTTKGQFDALKVLVPGLDLDQIKAQNDQDYERRTAANRKAKEARAAMAGIGVTSSGKVERVDLSPIQADIARASDHNKMIADRQARREVARLLVVELAASVEKRRKIVADLEQQIETQKGSIDFEIRQISETQTKLDNAPPLDAPLDTAQLASALNVAMAANAEADKQERATKLLAEAEQHETTARALTEAMEARETHKNAAIASAKLPVAGLSLGDEEVLIDGLPFAQAATSQKIKVSVALAMAMNPTIRVIRIEDGSLLDADAMKIVADMAKDSDFQVWVETVNNGTGSGIIIEDGHIKGE